MKALYSRRLQLGLSVALLALVSLGLTPFYQPAGGGADLAAAGGCAANSAPTWPELVPARCCGPKALACGPDGTLYLADAFQHTLAKVSPAGEISPLAGESGLSGSADGTGSAARFFNPSAVAVDHAGNLYVADTGNHTIRQVTPDGEVRTLAGVAGQPGFADGPGAQARFHHPRGLALDSQDNLYVADWQNHAIRKLSKVGTRWRVSTVSGAANAAGSADGPAGLARFCFPRALAFTPAGQLFVLDSGNFSIRTLTLAPEGWLVSTFLHAPAEGGADLLGLGRYAQDLTADARGNLLVVYPDRSAVWKFSPRGTRSLVAGQSFMTGCAVGPRQSAQWNLPSGITLDAAGNVYLADDSHGIIWKIAPTGTTTAKAHTTQRRASARPLPPRAGPTAPGSPPVANDNPAPAAIQGTSARCG